MKVLEYIAVKLYRSKMYPGKTIEQIKQHMLDLTDPTTSDDHKRTLQEKFNETTPDVSTSEQKSV